jgi:putative serine protease PepD
MKTHVKFFLLAVVLVALVGSLIYYQPAGALGKDELQRGLRAAVKLGILGPDDEVIGTCSGTILTNTGFILTNFHCVGQTDLYGPDEDFGLSHGELWNPNGLLIVALNNNPRKEPVPAYIAQVVAGNPDQDVAVIKIVADIDGATDLPEQLPIVPAILADSDTVEIGDEVTIIGFPGVGGDTVTLTEGQIAGFQDDDDDDLTDWFKTDALVNHGNSGGSAVNAAGEMIGIPSAVLFEGQTGDQMRFIKPLNQAAPIILRALKAGSAEGGVGSGGQSGGTRPQIPKGQNFGTLSFGTGWGNKGITGVATQFKSGVELIYAALPYQEMRDGTAWGYMWQYEGQDAAGDTELKWEFGKEGVLDLSVSGEEGLPDGQYNLQVYLKGKLVQEGQFVIGNPNPQDTPGKVVPQTQGVFVGGTIVDYDTRKPIEGAVIAFLIPGKTVKDFDAKNDTSLIYSFGTTDADGAYVAEVPLERGKTYAVIVGKKGYQRLASDKGLTVAKDDPDFLELKPIALQKK